MTTQSALSRNFQKLMQDGITVLREGDAHEALALFEQAHAIASGDDQHAEVMCMVGRCYGTLGRYAEAETVLQAALASAANAPAVLARAHAQFGIVRWQEGRLADAQELLEQAEQSYQRLGDTRGRTSTLGNLGMVYYQRGAFEKSIQAIRTTLELHESLNDLSNVSIQCNNLGECYRDLGDAERAQELHQRAITLGELLHAGGLQTDAWRNLGLDLVMLGDLDGALEAAERAFALSTTYHHTDIYLQSLGTLAEIHLRRGELDKAREVAGQLIEQAANEVTWRAIGRRVLGECQIAQGQVDEAVATLTQAVDEARSSSSEMLVLRAHAVLAGVDARPQIAAEHRAIARAISERLASAFTDPGLRATFQATPLIRGLLDRAT
jgi:tetratricopeptide (TPR) repeat protein